MALPRRTYCGSETYTSPEVLAGKRFLRIPQEVGEARKVFDLCLQVWSLGVLLWVMVFGGNPFTDVVAAEECCLTFPEDPVVSMDCRHLLASILTKQVGPIRVQWSSGGLPALGPPAAPPPLAPPRTLATPRPLTRLAINTRI